MVDVKVLDNSVPDTTGAVPPELTNKALKQLITTASQHAEVKCLLTLDAAQATVDVTVKANLARRSIGAVTLLPTEQATIKSTTSACATIKPRFIAKNHFNVRLAVFPVYNFAILVVSPYFT